MSKTIKRLLERVECTTKARIFGVYDTFNSAMEVQEALTLWEFYRNIDQHLKGLHNTYKHGKLRKTFLQEAMNHYRGNTWALLVLEWESLPVSVTKALLWRENIDFQSFESFLRRITHSQKLAIGRAYDEILELGVVPLCMKAGRGKWLNRNVTVKSLLAEPAGGRARYSAKSAWVRNFALLDFGFGLYPNGHRDDTKTHDHSRKFISAKNHVNDFSVNKHDGVYWWLYRTLRSNYLWNRYGTVKLRQHICPGFWFTMIMWAVLVMLSPALVALATIKFAALWLASKSWVVAKGAGFVGGSLANWLARHAKNEDNMAAMVIFAGTFLASALTLLLSLVIAMGTNSNSWFAFAPTALVFLTITKLIANDNRKWTWRHDPPPFGWILIAITIMWLPIEHREEVGVAAMFTWNGMVAMMLWLGATSLTIITWLAANSLYIGVSIFSLVVLCYIWAEAKKIYLRWRKVVGTVAWVIFIMGMIALVLLPQRDIANGVTPSWPAIGIVTVVASGSLAFIALVVLFKWLGSILPEKIHIPANSSMKKEVVTKEIPTSESKWVKGVESFLDFLFEKIGNFFVKVSTYILKPVWFVITWPFVTIWSIIRTVSLGIWGIILDLHGLWKTFNEVCPHVADEGDLRQ